MSNAKRSKHQHEEASPLSPLAMALRGRRLLLVWADVPLQLVKEKRRLQQRIAELEAALEDPCESREA